MIIFIFQSAAVVLGLTFAARTGWSGPRFERSLTGDSRWELLWLAGLCWEVTLVVGGGWPDPWQGSSWSMLSLFVTVILAAAYRQSYWWTGDLSPRAKRVMETTCRLPEARRMIRCWTWTTVAFALPATPSGSTVLIASGLALANLIAWRTRSSQVLQLAQRARKYGRTPWDKRGERFDIFLSYRRMNANVVRRIAEGLALRGVRVWFDEYVIRTRDRDAVERRLSEGIAAARKLVVFSNDSYAESPWCCRHELEPFIARLGVHNVVPVGMPREPEFVRKYGSLLAGCRWKDFATTDLLDDEVEEAIAHICASIGHESGVSPESRVTPELRTGSTNRIEIQAKGCAVSFDLAGFAFFRDVGTRGQLDDGDGTSAFYRREHRGTFVVVAFSVGLTWGERRSTIPAAQQLSDTQLMEQMRDFAGNWLEGEGRRVTAQTPGGGELADSGGHRDVGVHTVIAFGYRHFAMSYWNTATGAWARKYSIVVAHPQTGENLEVVVTFTHLGTFADFLAYGPTMDYIIFSMEVR